MSQFAGIHMEDWDLQAIVRGCTSEFATAIMEDNSQSFSFVPFDVQQAADDLLYGFSFSDCFGETSSFLDELDELYKPFYPQAAGMNQLLTSSSSSSSSSMFVVPGEVLKEPQEVHADLQKQQALANLSTVDTTNVITTTTTTTMPKKRKNQHKRVVKQVTADELSSDTWAWRKYGQKPIKGSPYPRSYYRCSSSKGCPARKQVERSSSDPLVFIISYTAEHSHGLPVRRNSLAGIAKKKSSTMKINPSTSDPETPTLKDSSCCSPISSTTALSPTSPLMTCLEDEFPQHERKRERMEEEEHMIKLDSMMSNSVLFSGYEGLDGLSSDLSAFECWFSDQIPATFQS